jgi:uncharacterized membrane protein YraQ (UPF0718 family)
MCHNRGAMRAHLSTLILPLMGWRFVAVRVVPSLAFPVLAGWLVQVFYQE